LLEDPGMDLGPRLALWMTQLPIQWVPGALSPLVKQPGYEANPSPPFIVEVKKACSYTSTPPVKLHVEYGKISLLPQVRLRQKAICMLSSSEPSESACQWVIMEKSHDLY
jgi:hypothetical protein